jgi:hypothetical protein
MIVPRRGKRVDWLVVDMAFWSDILLILVLFEVIVLRDVVKGVSLVLK